MGRFTLDPDRRMELRFGGAYSRELPSSFPGSWYCCCEPIGNTGPSGGTFFQGFLALRAENKG
jgi:hypothetical protein